MILQTVVVWRPVDLAQPDHTSSGAALDVSARAPSGSAPRAGVMVSLDNNAAERALRRPVMTRKNAYGSRNDDAARLAARTWTVTAEMAA